MFNLCYIFTEPNLATFEVYFLPVDYVIHPTKVLHNQSRHLGSIFCEYQLFHGLLCRTKWEEPISLGVLLTMFESIFDFGVANSSASSSITNLAVIGSSSSSFEFVILSFKCVVFGPLDFFIVIRPRNVLLFHLAIDCVGHQ